MPESVAPHSDEESPKAHLARWRGALITWTAVQLAASLVSTPIQFQVGLLGPLFSAAWLLVGLGMFVYSILSAFRWREWGAVVVPPVIALLWLASLLAIEPLDLLGDRLVFELRAPLYETAIAKLKAGEPKARACAGFRYGCGVSRPEAQVCSASSHHCMVSRDETLRVAFYHPEFFDNYLAYVYDPGGVYGRLDRLAPEDRDALRGELVPGAVTSCRLLRPPFYRCFFS
ncbi:MAG: hypothetical protein K2Q06_09750 [Parvularculaceae bacterium]|nr:hypothetical protein [Parvularculaceae bacterium]